MFGKIPGAEARPERREMRQRSLNSLDGTGWKSHPVSCMHMSPTLPHPNSRPWLQQVWLGRKATEDFALRSRAMSITRDGERPPAA
jgi:hypothetical protein